VFDFCGGNMSINRLLKNTGVSGKESKKFLNFTIAGLIGLVISFFASCNRNEIKGSTETGTSAKPVNVSTNTESDSYNVKKTTQSVQSLIENGDEPLGGVNKNCGPTPGYPCGMKYYTVSMKDFNLI
jgi:hypothetical protein